MFNHKHCFINPERPGPRCRKTTDRHATRSIERGQSSVTSSCYYTRSHIFETFHFSTTVAGHSVSAYLARVWLRSTYACGCNAFALRGAADC